MRIRLGIVIPNIPSQTMSAIQAPMRMKDLVAEQRAAYKAFRTAYHAEMVALAKKQAEEKAAFRQAVEQAKAEQAALREQVKVAFREQVKADKAAIRQQAKAEKAAIYQQVKAALRQQAKEEKDALRQQAKAEKAALRQQAKAEKDMLYQQAKVEPDFWTDHPNLNGRRDTMAVVLKSLSLPEMSEEHMDKLMIAYAEWLLTSKHGRKCRWSLMTAFATERLIV